MSSVKPVGLGTDWLRVFVVIGLGERERNERTGDEASDESGVYLPDRCRLWVEGGSSRSDVVGLDGVRRLEGVGVGSADE